jgi:hypothetical protein
MPLLAILDEGAHGALDDSLKNLYVQNAENKQFYLDISPDEAGKVAFNLQKEKELLKTNNSELLKQKGEANTKLKAYESLGKAPDEIKAALGANQPENVTKMVADYEEKFNALKSSYEEATTAKDSKLEALQAQLHKTLVNGTIAKLRAEHDLNDTADYVLRDYLKVEESDDGTATVRVYENGKPALAAGGLEKTPELLLNGFRENKQFLAIFNAPNGGGTGGTNNQKTVTTGTKTMRRAEYEAGTEQGQDFSGFIADGGKIID